MAAPNDRVKFATYRRDSESGLDYAWNRYYSNTTGRFLTPDPYKGSADPYNPQSWNRYGYGLGDPVGRNDPWGLCTAMLAGSTMWPDNSAPFSGLATALGATSGVPVNGLNLLQSVGSVIYQGTTGPNASTRVGYLTLENALDNTLGPIDVVAYSGGAQVLTTVMGLLTPAERQRIGSILYISPGTVGTLATTADPADTTVVLGSGPVDFAARVATGIPSGVNVVKTGCSHTDLACLLGAAAPQLAADRQDGPCPNQSIFTLPVPNPIGAGGPPGSHSPTYVPSGAVDGGAVWSIFLPWLDGVPVI